MASGLKKNISACQPSCITNVFQSGNRYSTQDIWPGARDEDDGRDPERERRNVAEGPGSWIGRVLWDGRCSGYPRSPDSWSRNQVTTKADSPEELLTREVLFGELKDKPPWRDFPLESLSGAWDLEGFRILQGHLLTKSEGSRDISKRRRSDHHPNAGFLYRFARLSCTWGISRTMCSRRRVRHGGRQMFNSSGIRGGRYVRDKCRLALLWRERGTGCSC